MGPQVTLLPCKHIFLVSDEEVMCKDQSYLVRSALSPQTYKFICKEAKKLNTSPATLLNGMLPAMSHAADVTIQINGQLQSRFIPNCHGRKASKKTGKSR